jgi:hypothetical protein
MVQGLDGQRDGDAGAARGATGRGDAAAHLHKAVKATAVSPGTVPAVGVEGGDDKRGAQRGQRVVAVPEPVKCVRAKAADQHVGGRGQALERRAAITRREVKRSGPLPRRHLRQDRSHLLEARRVDAQHVRAVGSQELSGDRAGDHPRQVQYADASVGLVRRLASSALASSALARRDGAGDSRQHAGGSSGGTRRRCQPLLARTHHRRAAARRDDGGLQVGALPGRRGGRDGLLVAGAEDPLDGRAVVGVVRVQPDPAISDLVVPGDRVPCRRDLPSDGSEQPLSGEGGARRRAIHPDRTDAGFRSRGMELGGRERRGRHRPGSQAGHVEPRGQHQPGPAECQGIEVPLRSCRLMPDPRGDLCEVIVHD